MDLTDALFVDRYQGRRNLNPNHQLLEILEATPDLVATWKLDGRLTYINRAGRQMLELSSDDPASYSIEMFYTPASLQQMLLQAVPETLRSGMWRGEMDLLSQGQRQLRVSQVILAHRNEKGQIDFLSTIVRDISADKVAEEAEHSQRVFAEALVDTAAALSSTLDFDELLERILVNVEHVVPHEMANIVLIEGDVARVRCFRAFGGVNAEGRSVPDTLVVSQTPHIQAILKDAQPVIVADTFQDPNWVRYPEAAWVHAHLSAPIVVKGSVIGIVNLDSSKPGFYQPVHAQRLKAFADQAAIALENARLLGETRRSLAEMEALNRLTGSMRRASTIQEMLPVLLGEILDVIDAPAGGIWLYEPSSNELHLAEARGWVTELFARQAWDATSALHAFLTQPSLSAQDEPRAAFEICPELQVVTPAGWENVCLPLRTGRSLVGMLLVALPGPLWLVEGKNGLLQIIAEMAANALHRVALDEQTQRHLRRLSALHSIDMTINASLDQNIVFGILLEQVLTQLEVDAAGVLVLNTHTQMLDPVAGRGFYSSAYTSSPLRMGQGLPSRAILERHMVVDENLSSNPVDFTRSTLFSKEKFYTYFGIPLIAKGQVKGVLEIFHRSPLHPNGEWIDFAETLGGQAAIAVENASLLRDLQRSNLELSLAYDATIEGWSRALDLRIREKAGHTQRVTDLTLRLAVEMKVPEAQLVHIRHGALLHDIGKMAIPDTILFKRGPLDEDERQLLRLHPTHAQSLLAPIAFLRPALDIPYCHHEWWNGSGYPRGLRGDQIPLAARIFAVADVWDALTIDRPYRSAISSEKARLIMLQYSGVQFDPQVVEIFFQMLDAEQRLHTDLG